MRADPHVEFLSKGLVPPPREPRGLPAVEQNGKEVYESPRPKCVTCNVPASDISDRSSVPLVGFKALSFFDDDPKREYYVPSLIHVGGTPPYYHAGSATTLEALVDQIKDRMGRTSHLSADERAALVAYLRTL